MANITITELRNLADANSSLLFAVDGENETFNVSLNTLYEYILGRKGDLETGTIEMYMGEAVPTTHAELDGRTFDPLVYPKMGALFPSGKLPDTRGMMLKHSPSGRAVLSFEAEAVKSHYHTATFLGIPMDPHDHDYKETYNTGAVQGGGGTENKSFRTSKTSSESAGTPKGNIVVHASGSAKNLVDNIAVKFIIKKA